MNWLTWALLAAVFAALTAIFAKVGVKNVSADMATLIRTVIILLAILMLVLCTQQWRNPLQLPGQTLGFLALSGLAATASWVCYFRAMKLGPASKVAAVDKLSVMLVALFAIVFLHERATAREWTGIALIGIGGLLLALKRN